MSGIDEKSLWKACEPMREDGMAISRYLEQLSGLLFLKACKESGKITFEEEIDDSLYLPEEYRWDAILESNTDSLERYEEAVTALQNDGPLAQKAFDQFTPQFTRRSTFDDTVRRIEDLNAWNNFGGDEDLLGAPYEYLLSKYADKAEGAGEYFTPRPLIKAMVEVTDPDVGEEVIDPASGTNGFLIESYNYLRDETDNFKKTPNADVESQFASREIRTETYRLGLINYLLHDINPAHVDAMKGDSLRTEKDRSKEYDIVLANPPFGSDIGFTYNSKCDSTIEMNFLMMMMDLLTDDGRAAIIVPEGILFDRSKEPARDELLNHYNIDVILALPEDTFQPYAGVDANVLFFERDEDGTDEFWFYDARSDYDNIKNSNPLTFEKNFADFVEYWDNREECDEYFKVDVDEVDEDNKELHLKKYKEYKYEGHRPPAEIAQDIKDELSTIENTLDQMVGDADD